MDKRKIIRLMKIAYDHGIDMTIQSINDDEFMPTKEELTKYFDKIYMESKNAKR